MSTADRRQLHVFSHLLPLSLSLFIIFYVSLLTGDTVSSDLFLCARAKCADVRCLRDVLCPVWVIGRLSRQGRIGSLSLSLRQIKLLPPGRPLASDADETRRPGSSRGSEHGYRVQYASVGRQTRA